MSKPIIDSHFNELINNYYYINNVEESLAENPEAYKLPSDLNDKIFENVVKKLLMRDSKIQESIKHDSLNLICKKALKICNIDISNMSKILDVPKVRFKKFVDGTAEVFTLGPKQTANVLIFFSISIKKFNKKLISAAESIEYSTIPYASQSRLIGGHSGNRGKKRSPKATYKNIDKFLGMVKKELEIKDRYDLL